MAVATGILLVRYLNMFALRLCLEEEGKFCV